MMTRAAQILGTLMAVALLAGGCGDDESGAEPASLVTVGDLALDLPISVPDDIPAPSDGEYGGDASLEPWSAIQIGSRFDPEELRAAIRAFGDTVEGSRFDEAIGQVTYQADLDGAPHTVYVWVRTNADIDLSTILEIGTVLNE